MDLPKLSRKEQLLVELLDEVSTLKQAVDAMQQEITTLQVALNQFGAQYHVYARTLQRRRQELERNIQFVRFQLENIGNPDVPSRGPVESDFDMGPETRQKESITGRPEIGPLQITEDQAQRSKVIARNFFAWFWHPDTGNVADLESMHQLNTAFKDSKDIADMLIVVPWSGVWMKPGENETIGEQIVRLSDWCDALKQAIERLDANGSAIQRHEFYQPLQEKQAADQRGEDYFAQVAVRERDEILRLEQSLSVLQSQLEALRKHA
jgi:hypothetical protein